MYPARDVRREPGNNASYNFLSGHTDRIQRWLIETRCDVFVRLRDAGLDRSRIQTIVMVLLSCSFVCSCERQNDSALLQINIPGLLDEQLPEARKWVEDSLLIVFDADADRYLRKVGSITGGATVSLNSANGKGIAYFNSKSWPLLLSFRPQHDDISFVEDNNGDRRFALKLWNFKSGKVDELDVPIMSDAARWMRWSADGKTLLMIVRNAEQSDDVWKVSLDGATVRECKKIYTDKSVNCIYWAPDESRFAAVSETRVGVVSIVSLDGTSAERIDVREGTIVRDCLWSADGKRVYFRTCDRGASTFALMVLTVTSKVIGLVSNPQANVGSINLGDKGVIFTTQQGDTGEISFCDGGDPVSLVHRANAKLQFAAHKNDRLIFIESSETVPETLYTCDTTSGNIETILRLNLPAQTPVGPQRISVPIVSGGPVEALIWRPADRDIKGVVVAFPVRRTFGPSAGFDGTIQYLVSMGFAYVAFDYAPTSDRSPGWDLRVSGDDISYSIEVTKFAIELLNYRGSNIVAFGESNSTGYAARAAVRAPQLFKKLVLRGLTAGFAETPINTNDDVIVYGLQGMNDPFTPDTALKMLKDKYPRSAEKRQLALASVPGEGHVIRKPPAKAIRAALLSRILSDD